jgi:lysophospholipase L1-like esterase
MKRKRKKVTILQYFLCLLAVISLITFLFLFKSGRFSIVYFGNDDATKIDNMSTESLTEGTDKKQEETVSKNDEKPEDIQNAIPGKGSDSRSPDKNTEGETLQGNMIQGSSNDPSPVASSGSYDNSFSDSIFIGDSITEGLSAYELIDESRIISEKGFTIKKVKAELKWVVKAKPERIFIQLGLNDMLYGISSEKYVSDYQDLIHAIQDNLPDTKIYLQSIFPVSAKVEIERPLLSNKNIDEFNQALSKMCDGQGTCFVDVSSLVKDDNGRLNENYSPDGIHLKFKAYGLWLDYLKEVQ